MSNERWTPGPWAYDEGRDNYTHIVRGPGGSFMLQLRQDASGETRANARLISAAPEMFEALDRMADLFKSVCGDPSTETGWKTIEQFEVWDRANLALAKAWGNP